MLKDTFLITGFPGKLAQQCIYATSIVLLLISLYPGLVVAMTAEPYEASLQSADTPRSSESFSVQEAFDKAGELLWRRPAQVTGSLKPDQVRWYSLRLDSSTGSDQVLEIPHPLLGVVDIWARDSQGKSMQDRFGMRVPFSHHKHPGNMAAFIIPGDFVAPVDVLIRVDNQGPMEFSTTVRSVDEWLRHEQGLNLFYGAFYGAMLVLLFYNLFLAWGLKDASYLLYVLFVACLLVSTSLLSGFGKQFLWPGQVGIESRYLFLVSACNTVAGLSFVNVFLGIRKISRPLWLISLGIIGAALGLALLYTLGYQPDWLAGLIYLNIFFSLIYYMVVPVVAYLRGVRYARFAILALWVYPISVLLYFWQLFSGEYWLRPLHLWMAGGMLLEGILLSLALADKINLLRQDKQRIERQAASQRRQFARGLIHTQEREREKFAAVLHDSIGHDLLILKHGLKNLAGWSDNSQVTNREILHRLQGQCENALVNVRQLSQQMHPHMLKRLGLSAAIETMLENAANAGGLEWAADLDDVDDKLDMEQASTVYRVIQEALNNILKHAQASEVLVSMRDRGPQVVVSIKDDGTGLPPHAKNKNWPSSGFGTSNMKGRVELLSGWFRLIRTPGEGTEVRFGLPYR